MSIPITQEMLDSILRAQRVAAQAAAAAGAAEDQTVMANISPDPEAPLVVAIRGRSVYEWDDDTERVGEYLGFLSVPAAVATAATATAAAPPEGDAEHQPPEELTVMPEEEDDTGVEADRGI